MSNSIVIPIIHQSSFTSVSKDISIITNKFHKCNSVFKRNTTYEGTWTTYFSVLRNHENKVAMYYRSVENTKRPDVNKYENNYQKTCMLISDDNGKTFKRPNLNKINFNGNKKNNIMMVHKHCHNFYPCYNGEHYYAIAGCHYASFPQFQDGIYLYKSKDGINWEKVKNIITRENTLKAGKGSFFDALNSIVYNPYNDNYYLYVRYNPFRGVRSVQITNSNNPSKIGNFTEIDIPMDKLYQYYCPNVFMYPQSNVFIGLTCSATANKKNKFVSFIYSENGYNWKIIEKDMSFADMPKPLNAASGIVVNDNEMYIYIENFNSHQVVRYSVPLHRMRCASTKKTGIIKTKLYKLTDFNIEVNFKSNAKGYLQVSILNKDNSLVKTSVHMEGNHFNKKVEWKGETSEKQEINKIPISEGKQEIEESKPAEKLIINTQKVVIKKVVKGRNKIVKTKKIIVKSVEHKEYYISFKLVNTDFYSFKINLKK